MTTNFDFTAFKNGKTATTKAGSQVKFICETRGQMMVSIKERYGQPYTAKYELNGKKYKGGDSPYDLTM